MKSIIYLDEEFEKQRETIVELEAQIRDKNIVIGRLLDKEEYFRKQNTIMRDALEKLVSYQPLYSFDSYVTIALRALAACAEEE